MTVTQIEGSFDEKSIRERRRRQKVIRIFPNKESTCRLVTALLAEKHEEWSSRRRHLSTDEFYERPDETAETEARDIHFDAINRTLQSACPAARG